MSNPLYIKIGMSRIKPNNPIIGNTLPMSEIKPINVQMNVTIVMTIISTKYCFENGVRNERRMRTLSLQ